MKTPLLSLLAALSTTAAFAADIGIKVRLGLEDKEATDWSGTVTVSPGKVTLISGWRFLQQDKVDGITGWSCRTRPNVQANQRRSNNPGKESARPADAVTSIPLSDNGVLISFSGVSEDSKVTIKTAKGECTFAFSEIPPAKSFPNSRAPRKSNGPRSPCPSPRNRMPTKIIPAARWHRMVPSGPRGKASRRAWIGPHARSLMKPPPKI
jgi:hypothetical protein